MTRSEYQELVQFLGPKLDAINGRFDVVEERLTRVEVSVEENRHHIQILSEGIEAINQNLGRFQEKVTEESSAVRAEMAMGFSAVRAEMATGFSAVRAEMAGGFRAQEKMIKGLGARVDRWDGRSA